jgi:miniconductance mechanosensitive channel
MIVLWGFGIIFMILFLFDTSVTQLIATFGAISAIIILIFRDAILGFAASIQVSLNDLVRIGDTITVEKFGADGEVIEINLSTVLIRNFDHTITTIPTYSLFSNSFRNWRGMYNSEGRRIKRYISVRSNSIRFINQQELAEFANIQLISKYVASKVAEQRVHHEKHHFGESDIPLNGLHTTNLTLFRKDVTAYLEHHSSINKNLIVLCRQLQPTPQGIPIEIYAYSKVTEFEQHEHIVAEIMEHILSSVIYFDLQLFEQPAGKSALE